MDKELLRELVGEAIEISRNDFSEVELNGRLEDLIAKAIPIIAKHERERFDEAIVLVCEVAGLNQEIFGCADLWAMAERAERILKALKDGE